MITKKDKETDSEKLKNDLEKQKELAETYLNDLKRIQADFENYIKRAEKQQQEFRKYASAEILKELINLKEDFERALKELKTDKKEVSNGIEMIYSNLNKLLENNGIKEINVKGEKLDPMMHEVLQFREDNKDNIVLEEVQRGYTIYDKVLRPAKVIVAKNKTGGNKNE